MLQTLGLKSTSIVSGSWNVTAVRPGFGRRTAAIRLLSLLVRIERGIVEGDGAVAVHISVHANQSVDDARPSVICRAGGWRGSKAQRARRGEGGR